MTNSGERVHTTDDATPLRAIVFGMTADFYERRCGGRTFRRVDGPGESLVAALPYKYDPQHGRPAGYFGPSNILHRDGYWYVFIFAESYGAQRRGACVLRSADITDPTSWRAWDGQDFTIAFVNPYSNAAFEPRHHVCTPVPGVSSTISGVSRLPGGEGFVALIAARRRGSPGDEPVAGIYYMTSADLIAWSKPKLLLAQPIMFAYSCDATSVYGIPLCWTKIVPFATLSRSARWRSCT